MSDLTTILDRLTAIEQKLSFQLSKKDVLTVEEAAHYSGMKENTVRAKCRQGKISYSRPDGKEIYIQSRP
jgi:excisionase family DNA binding protein